MGNIVKFAKPYSFEGTEYTEVDLSGMDKLTIQDMDAGWQDAGRSHCVGYDPRL